VTLADRRIATRRWGRSLLRGLPPMLREIFPTPALEVQRFTGKVQV